MHPYLAALSWLSRDGSAAYFVAAAIAASVHGLAHQDLSDKASDSQCQVDTCNPGAATYRS
jgi:hypothetical protein